MEGSPTDVPPGPGIPGAEDQPTEEELRARIEESLSGVRVQDVVLESVVTIVNLTARRIGKEDERDLVQAKVGIEAIRALLELLEPEPQTQVRNALSELQVLYARAAGGGEAPPEGERGTEGEADGGTGGGDQVPRAPAGGERPSGLWTPPGS